MDEDKHTEKMIGWYFGTFHTTLFVWMAVFLLHFCGNLASSLSGVGTVIGLFLFVSLWLTTCWSARMAFSGLCVGPTAMPLASGILLARGSKWGALNGVIFWWILICVIALPETQLMDLLTWRDILDKIEGLVFGALFGSIPASIIGCLIGFVFSLIDDVLLEVSRRIFVSCAKIFYAE